MADSFFIDYYRPQWTSEGYKAMCLERSGNSLANRLRHFITAPNWNRQRRMFREFLECELELCDARPYLEGGEFDHDAFYCAGSDQTWNVIDNKGLDSVYFLANVPDERKKIALSASFGRTSLGYRVGVAVAESDEGLDCDPSLFGSEHTAPFLSRFGPRFPPQSPYRSLLLDKTQTPERLVEWRLVAERAIDASLEFADEMETA
ncbi:hypothetical protein [Parafannyhessea umbonata]|uniref:Uncharacterized protein n=1 Tax=Parafannyhessea umbonata TaxID=604330 RepID=A0A6N7X6P7_9ACTN|nr:hypothetical protein [Parafannyhessea umbonata]MST60236.1 hypothetical protein [Parafannyhessea umbonata]